METEKEVLMEKWDRNVAMLEDRKSGMTYKELGEKYDVSRQRAHELIGQTEKVLEKRAMNRAEQEKERAFADANPIISSLEARGRNALNRAGIIVDADLAGKTEDELREIRGVGDLVIDRLRSSGWTG